MRPTAKPKARASARARAGKSAAAVRFPLDDSVGYQVRTTHRLLQRMLQIRIEPFGVTLGMWYFLRALWEEDGLTQRELSRRIGTMEPTTLTAIQTMERGGLVKRVRNKDDRRKLHVHLTPQAIDLKKRLLPIAQAVVDQATRGFADADRKKLLGLLGTIQQNLGAALGDEPGAE
jgi:MarR family transcriptional regulator, organic hydroperoxide resistance regulator